MLNEFLDDDPPTDTSALYDVDRIARLLRDAARSGEVLSYSELLLMLGYRFTRPKMRSLCKTLDVIDRRGAAADEPELAALVVREGDRLPGQGWWVGRSDYHGEWTGPAAKAYLDGIQARAFAYWRTRV